MMFADVILPDSGYWVCVLVITSSSGRRGVDCRVRNSERLLGVGLLRGLIVDFGCMCVNSSVRVLLLLLRCIISILV